MIGPRALRTDVLRGHPVSNARLAPPRPMARRPIRNRFKPTLTGNHCKWCKRCRVRQRRRVKCSSGPPAHLATHARRARRVSPVFSVLQESKAQPRQNEPHSCLTTAFPVSMAISQSMLARRFQRPHPTVRIPEQTMIAARVAIVVVVADVMHDRVLPMHDRVPMHDPAPMIGAPHANRARPMIPIPKPQAKPTARQLSQVSKASIPPTLRVLPTGCSTILAMARLRLDRIPAHSATPAVRWIARHDATAIIVKSARKAHHRFASDKARVTA